MTLRAAVEAWIAAEARAQSAFEENRDAINRLLEGVGGYATTSPDEHGFCKSYFRQDDSFGGGVEKAGARFGGTGRHADTIAPHHADIGDRCFQRELEWRERALSCTNAQRRVEELAILALGGMPEGVTRESLSFAARAFVQDEQKRTTAPGFESPEQPETIAEVSPAAIAATFGPPFNWMEVATRIGPKGENAAEYLKTIGIRLSPIAIGNGIAEELERIVGRAEVLIMNAGAIEVPYDDAHTHAWAYEQDLRNKIELGFSLLGQAVASTHSLVAELARLKLAGEVPR